MTLDVMGARSDYLGPGIVKVQLLQRDYAETLARGVAQAIEKFGQVRDKETGGSLGGFGERRRFRDAVLATPALWEALPETVNIYHQCRALAELVTGRPVIESPYESSAVTAKLYRGPGQEHGWHVESNSVTVNLYLTTHRKGGDGRMEWCAYGAHHSTGRIRDYWPQAGEAVVIRGHDTWHRVPATTSADLFRVLLVQNLYHPDDVSRPAGIDAQHYGTR